MEIDQVLKQVEWLDDERRKDKDIIAKQEERIIALEGNIKAAHQEIKNLSAEITRLSTIITRMDSFDEALLQSRVEINQKIEEVEKLSKQRDSEIEKVRRVEMRAFDASLVDLRKELEPIAGLKRGLSARVEEENRLARLIDELRVKINEMRRSEEEYSRTYRIIEDSRRQDSKRMVDLQGEVAALRKRADEQRGQVELVNSNFRKVEGRLNELLAVETERRDEQIAFLEKQALLQVEYERAFKDWEARIATVDTQAGEIEAQLQSMDGTHRTVKRTKDAIDELSQRVERRVNEITEMQRLSEERFRQEWVTFKADDQKRWTNYTLSQEEQRTETTRNFDKIIEQVTHLEDNLQDVQDMLAQMAGQTERRLQALLAAVHEWVSENERVAGRVR